MKKNLQIKLGALRRCKKEYKHYFTQLAAQGFTWADDNGQQAMGNKCPFSSVQSQESVSVYMDAKLRLQDFAKQLVDLLNDYEPQAQEHSEALDEKTHEMIDEIECLYKEAQAEIESLKHEHPEVKID